MTTRHLSLVLALLAACGSSNGDNNADGNNNGNIDPNLCGNGTIEGAEECDDGVLNSDADPDACRTNCLVAHCGDGVADAAEACDDGLENSDDEPDACRVDCTLPFCGDGVPDPDFGEECDDQNGLSFDGCTSGCTVEDPIWLPVLYPAPPAKRTGTPIVYDVARDKIFLFGGADGFIFFLADTWEYDGAAAAWTKLTPAVAPPGRWAHALAYDEARQRVVLFGGNHLVAGTLGDTWEYDPVVADWTQITAGPAPSQRQGGVMIYDEARQQVVMFGGTVTGTLGPFLDETWVYDGTWAEMTPAISPAARWGHGFAYDATRDRGVLFAGTNGGGLLGDTWEYDGAANTWTPVNPPNAPSPRLGHQLTYDRLRGVVVMSAGFDNSGILPGTWEYDGITWTQVPTINEATRRRFHGMTFDRARGVAVVFGGEDAEGPLTDLAEYDGVDWQQPTIAPRERLSHAMAWDTGRARGVLFGGGSGSGTFIGDDTWEFDPVLSGWTEIVTSPRPMRRTEHRVVFAPNVGRVVLFGGRNATQLFDDTWEYDGAAGTWAEILTASAPGGRVAHSMTWDSANERVILFGGFEGQLSLSDLWEYDPQTSTWSEAAPPNPPPPRLGGTLAFDDDRGVLVLFGGYSGAGHFADTWEYDGVDWTETTPAPSPAPRALHNMVYYGARRRVVLFGGGNGIGDTFEDTWEYDGAAWVETTDFPAPPARFGASAVYDDAGRRVLVFGGLGIGYVLLDDLWSYRWDGGWPDEICDNGTDDDSDTFIDTDDPDCQ